MFCSDITLLLGAETAKTLLLCMLLITHLKIVKISIKVSRFYCIYSRDKTYNFLLEVVTETLEKLRVLYIICHAVNQKNVMVKPEKVVPF